MNEFSTTRTNELIDPALHIWGWEIPVYLFLGGLVAGMMIFTGYFLLSGKHKGDYFSIKNNPLLGIIILSLGMFALFLDLEHKLYVWRMYMTFQIKSPMSWGSWILIFVYPALIMAMFIKLPGIFRLSLRLEKLSEKAAENKKFVSITGYMNIILGVLLGIYTGVLLSAFNARPLWNSPILPFIFLSSGLSSAAAFIHLRTKDSEEREYFAKKDNLLIITELIMIALYFIGMLSSSGVQQNAVLLVLTGKYAADFWVFVVFMGLIIPLIIQTLATNHKIKHTAISPGFVMLGGLLLRFVIVYAGQYSHY